MKRTVLQLELDASSVSGRVVEREPLGFFAACCSKRTVSMYILLFTWKYFRGDRRKFFFFFSMGIDHFLPPPSPLSCIFLYCSIYSTYRCISYSVLNK